MGCHCNAYVPIPKFFEWIGIVISVASFIPLLVAISTQKWTTHQDTSTNITKDYTYGLWTYCYYENCIELKCGAIIDTPQATDEHTINYLGGVFELLGAVTNIFVFIIESIFLSNMDRCLLNSCSILLTSLALVVTALGLTMYVNQADKILKTQSYDFSFGLACLAMGMMLTLLIIGIIRSQAKKPYVDSADRSDEKAQVYWKDILLGIMCLLSLISFILLLTALASNFWLRHKSKSNQCHQYYYGLWKYCYYRNSNQISCDTLSNLPKDKILTKNNNPRIIILLATILHFIYLPIFYFLFKNRYAKFFTFALAVFSATTFILSLTGISVYTKKWKDSESTFNWEYSYIFCWIATFGCLITSLLCIAYWFAPEKPTETRTKTLSTSRRPTSNGNSNSFTEPEFTIPTYIIDPYEITDSPNMVHKRELAAKAKEKAELEAVSPKNDIIERDDSNESTEAEEISDYILEMIKEVEETDAEGNNNHETESLKTL